jgi:nicotinamidase-related amidase
MTKALLVIDLQKDYFPEGKFPLCNTDVVLKNVDGAIDKANAQGVPVIHIKDVAKGWLLSSTKERRVLTSTLDISRCSQGSDCRQGICGQL